MNLRILKLVSENVYEVEHPLAAPGLRINHRMTVARLGQGDLWVHSPVAFDEELASELEGIGRVRHFVAPSRWHDLHWPEWFNRYPEAAFCCGPGMSKEHPELVFSKVLTGEPGEGWGSEISSCYIEGMPRLNEIVFLHRPSGSLIVADLLFNLEPSRQPWFGRFFLKLNGLDGKPGCSRLFRLFIKDRRLFQKSLRRVLEWEFSRIVPGHGAIVEQDAKEHFRRAFSWALE